MTQEERDAIRARCEAVATEPWKYGKDSPNFWNFITDIRRLTNCKIIVEYGWLFEFIAHAHQDIPTLLDALDEAEIQNFHLGFKAKEWHEKGIFVKEGLEKVLADCLIDRDRWKTRSEALERAIIESIPCETCVCQWPKDCGLCEIYFGETNENNWQFDEARFAANEPDEPNQQQH